MKVNKINLNKVGEQQPIPKSYKYLGLLTTIYITLQLVSDISAGKIVQLGIFTVSATVLYFPLTYIFSDILTEVYGYAKARSVIWLVLLSSILAGALYTIVVMLPPAIGFEANQAYTRVLGQLPRILVGGWIAVWVGGILNDYTLAKMKLWTAGKHLWLRTISSTILGEGANTLLFYVIALYAIIPTGLLFTSVLSAWLLKVVIEIVMTPFTYGVVAKLKKAEQEDYYDTNTNFNPLIFKTE